MSRVRRLINALLASAFILASGNEGRAATRFDPALRFRARVTEHFIIYFHQGEDRLARRLATIAEETWHKLQRPLGVTPPGRTHVVLADQTEFANGYATPLPYDTIVIYTVSPSGSQFEFDDWLQLAFTHEFTHIVHLDRSEGWARVVRSMFGRTAFAFPNIFLPAWQVEGIATYEESAITGEGRLHAGDFRAIAGEAARRRVLEPLDRVNGGLTDWPAGAAAYAYGVGFHEYLVDRFDGETLAALAGATARRVPYTASRAFQRVYGQSLGRLWRDFEASLVTNAPPAPADDVEVRRLTHQGFAVSGPRFDRFACAGCPLEIVYSAANPHGFPGLYRVSLDGSPPRRVTNRSFGSTTGIGRDAMYFDQVEQRRNVGVYSDLYVLSRADGRVRQLTSDARLLDPDLSPDGETLVCVQDRPGQRDLVLVRLVRHPTVRRTYSDGAAAVRRSVPPRRKPEATYEISTLVAEPETQFNAPKWSPDGATIAVERHHLGEMPQLVLVDMATRASRVVAAEPRARFVMPAWRPDGAALVAAVARDEQTFNLFEIALDGSAIRQVTHTTGGALWPEIAPDGKTIVFAGYTTDGYDLFAMPYPPEGSPTDRRAAGGADSRGVGDPPTLQRRRKLDAMAEAAAPQLPAEEARPATEYSPMSTLKPTSWTPVIETDSDQIRAGAGLGGVDLLGYHAYAATATWRLSSPSNAPAQSATAPDWQIYYVYDRWRPTLYAAASSATSFYNGPVTAAGTPTAGARRERVIESGVIFPIRHTRVSHSGLLSVARALDDFAVVSGSGVSRERTPLRAAWQTLTSRTYGYSISREDGVAAGGTVEVVRKDLGSSANATILTGDVRAYLAGAARHHVLAVRLAAGSSNGDQAVGRTFLLGGSSPGDSVIDFGSSAFSLLRGFGSHAFAGTHVALTNLEYRWPLARPQRGVGTWPIFLHSVHGAVFADAGETWTGAFRADAIKTSVGIQLSADVVAGYFLPLTATVGAAWGRDPGGVVTGGVSAYVRVGRAF